MITKFGVIILTLVVFTTVQGQQFQFTMHGADSLGHARTIVFGVDPLATFCGDTALGEYNSFPPFPVMFSWTNPRESGICDFTDCFDCGRVSGKNSLYPVDLRPYEGRTQIDTYRVSMYSYDGGYPFDVTWEGDFSTYCDSMKLTYTGSSAGVVVIDMFNTSAIQITDPTVSHADIIRWGVKIPPPPTPVLIYPPQDGTDIQTPVMFRWISSSGSDTYRLQVSSDSFFVAALHFDSTTTDTSKLVGDLDAGEVYYWRVHAQKESTSSSWSEVRHFQTFSPSVTVQVLGRWNLLSLPMNTPTLPRAAAYPTSQTEAYFYSMAGHHYVSSDSLSHGVGYWLRFSSDEEVKIEGALLETDTVALIPGWNLIGSIASPVPVSSVISDPPSLATSSFYGYNGVYAPSDTIYPGRGYWVWVSDSGKLILSSASAAMTSSNAIHIVQTQERPPASPGDEISGYLPTAGRQTPAHTSLGQNYPNPFNPTTTIRYELPSNAYVRLTVYDVLGNQISTLVERPQEAGFYAVTFDAGQLASGIYFYRLQAGPYSSIQKMTVMK